MPVRVAPAAQRAQRRVDVDQLAEREPRRVRDVLHVGVEARRRDPEVGPPAGVGDVDGPLAAAPRARRTRARARARCRACARSRCRARRAARRARRRCRAARRRRRRAARRRPSPPATSPAASAPRASSRACSSECVRSTRKVIPRARSAASTRGSSCAARPRPALGLTMRQSGRRAIAGRNASGRGQLAFCLHLRFACAIVRVSCREPSSQRQDRGTRRAGAARPATAASRWHVAVAQPPRRARWLRARRRAAKSQTIDRLTGRAARAPGRELRPDLFVENGRELTFRDGDGRPAHALVGVLENGSAEAPFTSVGERARRPRRRRAAPRQPRPRDPRLQRAGGAAVASRRWTDDLAAQRFLRRVRFYLNHPDDREAAAAHHRRVRAVQDRRGEAVRRLAPGGRRLARGRGARRAAGEGRDAARARATCSSASSRPTGCPASRAGPPTRTAAGRCSS